MAATVIRFILSSPPGTLRAAVETHWPTESVPVQGHPGPAPWPRVGPQGSTSVHQGRCPRTPEGQGWPEHPPRASAPAGWHGREPCVLGGSWGPAVLCGWWPCTWGSETVLEVMHWEGCSEMGRRRRECRWQLDFTSPPHSVSPGREGAGGQWLKVLLSSAKKRCHLQKERHAACTELSRDPGDPAQAQISACSRCSL